MDYAFELANVFSLFIIASFQGAIYGCGCVYWVVMMDDDLTLFEINSEPLAPESTELPIRNDQVVKIRHAFENAEITSQQERKRIVDAAAARDVPSLRDLSAIEGRRIYNWIKNRETGKPKTRGSLWDEREGDTWIDKL